MVKLVYKYKNLILSDRRLRRKLKNISLTFTRSGVAYDYMGNSVPENTPRFTHLINGVIQKGILIEEAHTNLLSADASQSITHDSPYTTGTLNGTYTFQCEGTGSYVLSGGATGTVTKDSPQIKTISSATVTLTPATTSTLNQVLLKPYPLSFVLGGITQNAEVLNIPTSTLNIVPGGGTTLTIELEFFVNYQFKLGVNKFLSSHYSSALKDRLNLYYRFASQKIWCTSTDNAAATSEHTDITDVATGWNKAQCGVNSTQLKGYINGTSGGTPISSPKIPSVKGTFNIGSLYDGSLQCNTLIQNVTISCRKRSDSEISGRNSQNINQGGFKVDKDIKLVAPLKNNLSAYRVRG